MSPTFHNNNNNNNNAAVPKWCASHAAKCLSDEFIHVTSQR